VASNYLEEGRHWGFQRTHMKPHSQKEATLFSNPQREKQVCEKKWLKE
jgi:hypothetical protein